MARVKVEHSFGRTRMTGCLRPERFDAPNAHASGSVRKPTHKLWMVAGELPEYSIVLSSQNRYYTQEITLKRAEMYQVRTTAKEVRERWQD